MQKELTPFMVKNIQGNKMDNRIAYITGPDGVKTRHFISDGMTIAFEFHGNFYLSGSHTRIPASDLEDMGFEV